MENEEKTSEKAHSDNELLFKGSLANNITSIINNLIKTGGLVFIAYFIKETIGYVAGTETKGIFSFDFKVLTDLKANNYFYYLMIAIFGLFGFSGTTYGIIQRNLRRRVIADFAAAKEAAEKRIDPGRHSSRLLNNGTTRPEDI